MNCSLYKKLSFAALIIGSMFLSSCGSSGGGDEEEFEFQINDLKNKYWYANPYQNQNYSTDDAILVYRFNGGGDLVKQEFSGQRDNDEAGSWMLSDDNVLTIDDETSGNVREYTIDKSSTANHLFLKSSLGNWDFYSSISELEDLTADASIIREIVLDNGYVSKYRYEFEVKGSNVEVAKAILENKTYELVEAQKSTGEIVWRLNETDAKEYFDSFKGAETVKFYVRMKSGEEYKLVDEIYNQDIEALSYQNIDVDHNRGEGPLSVSVEWKALNNDNAFYYVQILNAEKDENNPLNTSVRQPLKNTELQTMKLEEEVAGDFKLSAGETFYVKVVAYIYEEDIDPDQGKIYSFNIQARSQYITSGGEW